ncbi:PD-(D/E)XK nuclease family transposase [Thomasclavelia saccharogumia]|uniref:PD-(D/E)XK nuclease family transposase n=1 Tax=Thomasclavelia saccharogumia TaxID=341225 RepID=UPI00047A2052|nr:PD-(D/E)XK nuclease family transposase [Thomasclavelia saccharogumia]
MTKEFYNDFKNDILFKYLLHDDLDPDCIFMLKLFIENILNIKCDQISVLNPDLNPKHISDKDMILDVKVKTTDGDIIDIEMQNSTFSKSHYYRFWQYGAALLAAQKEKSRSYIETMHSVYQIIFIDDIDKDNLKLIDTYRSTNEDGIIEKYNLITRSYVQLPYINIIRKQKSLKKMSEIELALYIFKNGIDSDIIGLTNQGVVKIMKKKLEMFNEDELLRDMYYKRNLNRAANESEKQEIYEKGLAKGRTEGALKITIDFIEARYGIREEEWVLSLNTKQLKVIDKIIFEEDEYERFKQRIDEIKETEK